MFAMYDSFTYTVLVVLEDLGFAPKGEGGAFVTDNGGNLRLGGALPTNTDGGGLSCTHPGMRGLFLLCEATPPAAGRGRRRRRWRTRRSRSRTAAAAGCRPRAPSCWARKEHDDGRLERNAFRISCPGPTWKTASSGTVRARGELRIQHCTTCGLHQHYPRMLCSHCGKQTLEWITASGRGTIYSFTVIRQNGVPPFNERVPFVVATVDLDEPGARLIASMPSLDPDDARIGMPCAPPSGRQATTSRSSTSSPPTRRGEAVARPATRPTACAFDAYEAFAACAVPPPLPPGVGVAGLAPVAFMLFGLTAAGLTIDTTSLASTASTCSGLRGTAAEPFVGGV